MIEAGRVLQPLEEQHVAIERLDTYASAGELADALASVRVAVDRSLRLLLRADPEAPEDARMAALAPDRLSLDDVVTALRRRDRISMELASHVHALDRSLMGGAGGGEPRPGDADTAKAAVGLLRAEVAAQAATPASPAPPPPPAPPTTAAPLEHDAFEAEAPGRSFAPIAGAILVLLILAVALLFFTRTRGVTTDRATAIGAFDSGDYTTARRGFEAIVGRDSADVTALLYLARIHRREERFEEAAAVLRTAVGRAGADADVRRELGWLFLDLGRPAAAVEQFERAREVDPASDNGWIGLIRALRAAEDPRSEQVLREAPETVRQQFGARG